MRGEVGAGMLGAQAHDHDLFLASCLRWSHLVHHRLAYRAGVFHESTESWNHPKDSRHRNGLKAKSIRVYNTQEPFNIETVVTNEFRVERPWGLVRKMDLYW
jgi:hypothetical protein